MPCVDATLASVLDSVAATRPEAAAIVAGDQRLTFAEFRARSTRLAAGFAALGLGHGDSIAIWMPGRPSWFVAQQACARIGAIVVPLDPGGESGDLHGVLKASAPRALLLADHLGGVDYFEVLHDVLPTLPDAIPGELTLDELPDLQWVVVDAEDEYPGCIRLRDVLDAGADAVWSTPNEPGRARAAHADDAFTRLYTSATTDATISHRDAVTAAWHTGETLGMTPDDRVLHALVAAGRPGGIDVPWSAWTHGAMLVLMDAWDPLRAQMLIERERCTMGFVNGDDARALDQVGIPLYRLGEDRTVRRRP
jgi:fatty-acyl-CoA synthase